MKVILFILIFIASLQEVSSQKVEKITKSDLSDILNYSGDKLRVVNFWASWCGPCVTELPGFQTVMSESDSSKVEFLFISLDFPSEADKKLVSFLKKHNYSFPALLMADQDYNSWIDMVDKSWQGNIPATLFFNNSRNIHHFVSEPMSKISLEQTIHSLLKN